MYEPEVNDAIETAEQLPAEIRRKFAEHRSRVLARTILPWGEHCTECVFPTCYTTCGLYAPRADGACRQFIDGMVRVDHQDGLSPYLLKLRFKGWAKLWTVGNLKLRSLAAAEAHERLNMAIGAVGRGVPLPPGIRPRVLRKINYVRRRAAEKALPSDLRPDWFLLECYNPTARAIGLTFTVRPAVSRTRPFQHALVAAPGYSRLTIPLEHIERAVDLATPFEVEIVPNDAVGAVLYFGLMDFVKEFPPQTDAAAMPTRAATWKCIVWDLDNTLWDGTLIEQGAEGVRVRRHAVDAIRETDQRGILHSIASKNNPDDALAVLAAHGLRDYFLYPQIGWQPKSEAIARIAALLNIGVDSIAFIDDQRFEREEVAAALPAVALLDAADCAGLQQRAECQVPVTAESRRRRQMYREQEGREVALETYRGDYVAFLRECRLDVALRSLDDTSLERVYELAQRTNQMNFSGNRYPESQLRDIAASPAFETYVVECRDRFGDYGIVGFALVDAREARLVDLMFSCRIQAKRVEHAVLAYLLRRFVTDQHRSFFADFRRTPRNAAAGGVFDDMGFTVVGERDGVTSLVFREGQDVVDEGIVTVRYAVHTADAPVAGTIA